MGRKPTGRPNGRPPIEIDWQVFEQLCIIHCTLEEMSAILKCSEDTLETKVKEKFGVSFSDKYREFASRGKASVRRTQYDVAVNKKDVQMLKHVGKHWLKQDDSLSIDHQVKVTWDPKTVLEIINKKYNAE